MNGDARFFAPLSETDTTETETDHRPDLTPTAVGFKILYAGPDEGVADVGDAVSPEPALTH